MPEARLRQQMIEFRLLGSVDLRGSDGETLRSVLAQPKRVALLAYLAVAQPGGYHRRDKLLGLFWLESDQDRGRAALRKAVYRLRQSLGEHVIVNRGDEEIGLAEGVLSCDTTEFERAVEAGDLEEALDLYRGDLLEGFYVSDAPDFERWLEGERRRLADLHMEALESLAERAEAAGEHRSAVAWWKRLSTLDPYNSRHVMRLIEAMAAAGDRGNALQLAQEHARKISEDLGMEPDAALVALTKRLLVDAGHEVQLLADVVPVEKPAESRREAHNGGRWRTRLTAGAVAIAAIVALVLGIRGLRTRDTEAAMNPNRIVVLPFTVRGDADLAYLQEGMVDLLAMALDGAGELTTVDPRAVISFVERETSGPLRTEDGRQVTARFEAGRYVLGDILSTGGRIRAIASLYDHTGDPQTSVEAVVESEARILELVDELARQLVVAGTEVASDELTRIGAATTESLVALKAYLRGESLFRSSVFNPSLARSAVAEYQEAVAADTAFALAYFRMAVLESLTDVSLQVGNAVDLARRFSGRLAPREQRLLECFAAFFDRLDGEEAERWCRAVLRDHPDNADAWWWLGDALQHFGLRRGRSLAEVRGAYERAIALKPTYLEPALVGHLSWLALVEEDFNNWALYTERRVAIQPRHPRARMRHLFVEAWRGEEGAQEQLMSSLKPETPLGRYLASHYTWPLDDRDATIQILRGITSPDQSHYWRALGHVLIAHEELAAGRLVAARAELVEAVSFDPDESLKSKVYLMLSPYLSVTNENLRGLRDDLVDWSPVEEDDHVWRLYLLGLLYERLGDLKEAERVASELDTRGTTANAQDQWHAGALAADLALYLRARLAARAARYEEALRFLDETAPKRWWPFISGRAYLKQVYERWLTAEVLVALDRREEALHWLAAFGMDGERSYMGARHYRMAEIHEELGNREKAVYHYNRFIAYWRDADPELQPRVEAARRAIEALSPDT